MRRLKNPEELPRWFSLENYQEAVRLDARGWWMQLEPRLKVYRSDNEGKGLYTALIPLDAWLPGGDESPVRPLSDADAHWLALDVLRMNGISSPKALERKLDEAGLDEFEGPYGDYGSPYRSQTLEMIDPKREREPFAALMIDLSVSDDLLREAFKKWLGGVRLERAALGLPMRKRRFSPADFNRWASNGILPYLDLARWADLHRLCIPDWLMGEALFPGPNAGDKTSRVSKTTKPLAAKMMADPGLLEALEKQALSAATTA